MTGPVNPHRITVALDRAKLFGPTADAKVGAREPDLDDWEAGRKQPTEAQLEKLGQLANLTREFFDLPDSVDPRIMVALVHLDRPRRCEWFVSMPTPPIGYERQPGLL